MRTMLEDFSASSLVNAMEMNVHEVWIRFARALGAIVHDEHDLLWFYSRLPFHLANGIVKVHIPADRFPHQHPSPLNESRTKKRCGPGFVS